MNFTSYVELVPQGRFERLTRDLGNCLYKYEKTSNTPAGNNHHQEMIPPTRASTGWLKELTEMAKELRIYSGSISASYGI